MRDASQRYSIRRILECRLARKASGGEARGNYRRSGLATVSVSVSGLWIAFGPRWRDPGLIDPENIWPLTSLATSQGPKWGVGVRQALFPNADIRRLWGCRLPDAILHGKRSCRPRSRAVQRLAVAEFLSEASRPDATGGCATGPRTKPRHARGADSASWSFAPGRPPLLAMRWPEATGLTSYLSGCLALTSQRCGLSHRQRSGSFHRTSACVRILPGASPHFVRAFRRL